MTTTFSQEKRLLTVETPLGKDVLLFTGFAGEEELSRLFRYELDFLCDNDAIDPADIVGKNITFSLRLRTGEWRPFNGVVSSFYAGGKEFRGLRQYRAEVVPWLWLLNRTSDCRIFQNKTIPQIIEKVLSESGLGPFEVSEIRGQHPVWEYCVQYRETDFNFVSRLMEQEGIFYFFRHEEGRHVLVVADQAGVHQDCPENEVACTGGSLEADQITAWEHRWELRPGKWAQTDYNFKTPATSLLTTTDTVVKLAESKKLEMFDYPGEYPDKDAGKAQTLLRMQEDELPHHVVHGESTCRTFTAGGKFTLARHDMPSEEGKTYVIWRIHHAASDETYVAGEGGKQEYENGFSAIPDGIVFRPARATPKPVVQGLQTAVVVGPGGEEIYTDEFGRIKVQFHWDREGKKDENSSCWIRVAQNWAGKKWGIVFNPRIGQEVVISFLEGDPDRPLVIGRVYNADQMPPYDLPSDQTKSTMKSRSSKGGSPDNFNEIRFEDKKGSEELFIQAEKNETITVKADKTESVGHDETLSVGHDRKKDVGNDETTTIGKNRTETVGTNETITIGGDRTRSVGKSETVTVTLTRTHVVGINESISVGAAQEITVGGLRAVTVGLNQATTVGKDHSETIGKNHSAEIGDNRTVKVGKDHAVKVGKKFVLEAGDEITIKTGSAEIVMKKNGDISIKGKNIDIKGSGDVVVKGSKIAQN